MKVFVESESSEVQNHLLRSSASKHFILSEFSVLRSENVSSHSGERTGSVIREGQGEISKETNLRIVVSIMVEKHRNALHPFPAGTVGSHLTSHRGPASRGKTPVDAF